MLCLWFLVPSIMNLFAYSCHIFMDIFIMLCYVLWSWHCVLVQSFFLEVRGHQWPKQARSLGFLMYVHKRTCIPCIIVWGMVMEEALLFACPLEEYPSLMTEVLPSYMTSHLGYKPRFFFICFFQLQGWGRDRRWLQSHWMLLFYLDISKIQLHSFSWCFHTCTRNEVTCLQCRQSTWFSCSVDGRDLGCHHSCGSELFWDMCLGDIWHTMRGPGLW